VFIFSVAPTLLIEGLLGVRLMSGVVLVLHSLYLILNYNILINHAYFLYITNLFDFAFEIKFDLRSTLFGKEVCDAVVFVAKCLTGRRKTVENAQTVFLLFVEP